MGKVTKNFRDGVLTVYDGTLPTPNELTSILDEGNLSWSSVQNVTTILDRGRLSHMRKGNEEPVSISFTIKYVELIKQEYESTPTLYEVLKFINGASGWQSSNTDECSDVKTLTLKFRIKTPCPTDKDEVITFRKFYQTNISFDEGEEYDTLQVEAMAFVTDPEVTKEDQL